MKLTEEELKHILELIEERLKRVRMLMAEFGTKDEQWQHEIDILTSVKKKVSK